MKTRATESCPKLTKPDLGNRRYLVAPNPLGCCQPVCNGKTYNNNMYRNPISHFREETPCTTFIVLASHRINNQPCLHTSSDTTATTFQLAWWGTHLDVCLLITPPPLGEPPVSCRTCTDGLPV